MPDSGDVSPGRPVARRRWWVHLVLIGSYPLGIGLLSLTLEREAAPALSTSAPGLLLATVVELALFACVFGIGWLASRASREALFLRWRRGFLPVPWGIGYSLLLRLGIAVFALVGAGVILVFRVMSPDELQAFVQSNQPKVEALVDLGALRDNPVYFWLMVTYVSFVVAGLREELWRAGVLAGMRVLWPRIFGSRGGQIGAAALAAVIFGIGHAPQGIVGATMAGLLGFGLGVIMVVHRSIWPAVIAHGCFNATSFALIPLVVDRLQEITPALAR